MYLRALTFVLCGKAQNDLISQSYRVNVYVNLSYFMHINKLLIKFVLQRIHIENKLL